MLERITCTTSPPNESSKVRDLSRDEKIRAAAHCPKYSGC